MEPRHEEPMQLGPVSAPAGLRKAFTKPFRMRGVVAFHDDRVYIGGVEFVQAFRGAVEAARCEDSGGGERGCPFADLEAVFETVLYGS